MSAPVFPIAEMFYSLQGEGQWAGTPMYFIRLAGCNVGKYPHAQTEVGLRPSPFQLLKPEHSTCTSFTGDTFICDTDYRVKERLTAGQIYRRFLDEAPGCSHVVFTGGEPMMHKELVTLLEEFDSVNTHLETSGTHDLEEIYEYLSWITCSPKAGFLPDNHAYINEYKFLVTGPEVEEKIKALLPEDDFNEPITYLQPVEGYAVAGDHSYAVQPQVKLAVEMTLRNPTWRLSLQAHKIWGVR